MFGAVDGGQPGDMKASELTTAPFRSGAALRDARLFHPSGALVQGRVTRCAEPGKGLPIGNGQVIGRMSKGIGTGSIGCVQNCCRPAPLPAWMSPEIRRRLPEQPLVVSIEQAEGSGTFGPLAVLEFDRDLEDAWPEDVAFDPTLNHADGVTLLPEWLTALRRRAYRGSRQGRDAE
ncbi:hypothetical protein QWI29_09710 [Mycolicibacterium neoaurum]|uniref:hypothetical protein n=1 Tax=Mycolicibacterium neoaurum TaxID=1795 RepID=UPI0026724068|nr:hypothetical protein [Mycolicibacterium neoaurum]MDO3400304.1 hypothetical protein [Mycolicibacterium neoaurum]